MAWYRLYTVACTVTLLLILPTVSSLAETRTVNVTLALICDIYEMTEQNGRGGYARIATAIKTERARTPNLIVAHAGDALSPSLMSGFDQGKHAMDLTNQLDLDLFVPGNHEFDFGPEVFRERMSEARFPVLAANLRDELGKQFSGIDDTKLIEFEGVTLGIVGLTAENSVSRSSPGNLQFRSSIETIKELIPKLREQGADLVLAVAHAPRRMDFRLTGVEGLDVLLSGDDHDLVVFYDGKTVMVEAKQDGEYLATVDLKIDVSGEGEDRRIAWWPRFRIIDTANVIPDAAISRQVDEYQNILSKELDVVIGTTATRIDSRKSVVRSQEAAIGNLIADALRSAFNADVALFNGGGIRGNRVYEPATVLTYRDIRTELPFGNKAVLLEMTGRQLLAVLENGLWYAGKAKGRFLQVAGVKIEADSSKVPGEKIVTAKVGEADIDPDAIYTVATNSFIASGREGFDVIKESRILRGINDGDLVSNLVTNFIKSRGTISPRVEGRIVIQ